MSTAMIPFEKMNGLGNKILVADMRGNATKFLPTAAIALAANDDTHFDQVMAVHDPRFNGTDGYIKILNSDGSMAEACGNGMRCVTAWMNRQDGRSDYLFETRAGLLDAQFTSIDQIRVNMGKPRFGWDEIPLAEEFANTRAIELQIGPIDDPVLHTPSVANIGNPQAIFWAPEDVWSYDLDRFGPMLENHPIFPDRANISIANIVAPNHIILRTWERGAGITLACGSAACAAAVCAVRIDKGERDTTITVPGGDLKISWGKDDFYSHDWPGGI